MYLIARRSILHTHTHKHTHTHSHMHTHTHTCTHTHTHAHTHTHLHCSFFLLTYTPRSVIRVYTYTGTCITSQAPYVYMHHTVKAYTCVGGKIYSFYILFAIHNRYATAKLYYNVQRNTLFLINAPFVKGTIITPDSNLTNHTVNTSISSTWMEPHNYA